MGPLRIDRFPSRYVALIACLIVIFAGCTKATLNQHAEPLSKDEAIDLAYNALSEHNKERLRLLGPVQTVVTEYRATEKHLVFSDLPRGKSVNIKGMDTYRIEFRTPRDMPQLGPTTAYVDRKTRKFLGCDLLF